MDTTQSDYLNDQMFDVYQSYQNKNSYELMDYLSKSTESPFVNNTTINTDNVNAMLNEFSEGLFPNEDLYTLDNGNTSSIFTNFGMNTFNNNQLSPQTSLNSSMDVNSIFSNTSINPEQLAEPSLTTGTRTNSITSLSSLSSAVKTPIENMTQFSSQQNIKFQQIRKSPTSSSASSSSDEYYNKSSTKSKRHSDSRLSLQELSNYLKLDNDLAETAKREQEILTIFKDELGFELGLKTWVRDTSSSKRLQLVRDLTMIVESRYHYGYDEKTIEVIIRRASYYTMQGRLRRERRFEQKIKGDNKRNKR